MLYAILSVSEQLEDKLLSIKDRHWVCKHVITDQSQRLCDLQRHCGLRRSVENDVSRETHCIGHLVVVKHEDWRLKHTENCRSLILVLVKTRRDQVKDQTELILALKNLSLCELEVGLLAIV